MWNMVVVYTKGIAVKISGTAETSRHPDQILSHFSESIGWPGSGYRRRGWQPIHPVGPVFSNGSLSVLLDLFRRTLRALISLWQLTHCRWNANLK